VTLIPLKNPEDPGFLRFLKAHEPLSLRIQGAIFEMKEEASIWVDDSEEPRLAIQRGNGWLAPLGDQEDVMARLDNLECMAAEMEEAGERRRHLRAPNEVGVLRLSAIPKSLRDAVAEKRDILRENGCGLYTLSRENFSPFRDGPSIDRIRPEEYELVASLAEYGEGLSYLEERLPHAPHAAVRVDGELAAYMIVHANGSIGMLHTIEKFRNRKLGRLVASALAEMQFERGAPVFCYIVDGNLPSQRVFTSLGFRRVADVSWCAFRREETSKQG